jgi:hypothetical protein
VEKGERLSTKGGGLLLFVIESGTVDARTVVK